MRFIRNRFRRKPASRGQALVEFALVVLPLLLLIVGIVQFGLLLNANVTLANAAREGARAGSIYVYRTRDLTSQVALDRTQNDQRRCTAVVEAVRQALGMLNANSPNFVSAACPSSGVDTWTAGDVRIEYTRPPTITTNDPREGYRIRVIVTYRQDIIVPLIGPLLQTDSNGRFLHTAEVTMVVN